MISQENSNYLLKGIKNKLIVSTSNKDFFNFEEEIKSLHNLTDAEARLANSLVNGLTLEEIANNTGLKYSTVKSYLKLVFQKTNTKKQHELVSYIFKSLLI